MSDLISRSEAMENYCNALCPKLQKGEYCNNCIVKAWLNNQPIAYDIDKVVEELKEWTFNADINVGDGTIMNHDLIVSKNAIEIVKQGGVSDDVCEWKSASDGEFIQNPHTKRLYSNEPSMQNVYCNTCGKKIKIVGD